MVGIAMHAVQASLLPDETAVSAAIGKLKLSPDEAWKKNVT